MQRIVAALEAEKFVIAASPTGRVRLGPTIQRLAMSVGADFVSAARPFLVKLSQELNETVDLATIRNDHLVFVDQVIGPQRLRAVSAVGEAFPLHCTANGKAYLAELSDDDVARLIGKSYEQRTPKTITRLKDLLKDLKVGAQGRRRARPRGAHARHLRRRYRDDRFHRQPCRHLGAGAGAALCRAAGADRAGACWRPSARLSEQLARAARLTRPAGLVLA